MSDESPRLGDILERDGDNWVVEEVGEAVDGTTVVTLRPRPVITRDTEGE